MATSSDENISVCVTSVSGYGCPPTSDEGNNRSGRSESSKPQRRDTCEAFHPETASGAASSLSERKRHRPVLQHPVLWQEKLGFGLEPWPFLACGEHYADYGWLSVRGGMYITFLRWVKGKQMGQWLPYRWGRGSGRVEAYGGGREAEKGEDRAHSEPARWAGIVRGSSPWGKGSPRCPLLSAKAATQAATCYPSFQSGAPEIPQEPREGGLYMKRYFSLNGL